MTKSQRAWASTLAKARAERTLIIWKVPNVTPRTIGRAAAMHCTCPCGLCTHNTPEKLRKDSRDAKKLELV